MRVYYLTSEDHALRNIKHKRVKASLFDDLNDPFELLAFNMSNQDQRVIWTKFKEHFTEQVGIVCFSAQWHNPVMWSHYGDKHKGICLGFDVNDEILKKVRYISKRKRFEIGNTLKEHKINPDILSKAIKYKFKEWSYEREHRGIVPLKEKDKSGHYFIDHSEDFILKEIILGARCEFRPGEFKEKLSQYSHKIRVIKARLAFNSFKVVQNKSIKVYENA